MEATQGGLPPAYIDPRRWARAEIVRDGIRDAVLAWRVRRCGNSLIVRRVELVVLRPRVRRLSGGAFD
jgi:hypothetical protein